MPDLASSANGTGSDSQASTSLSSGRQYLVVSIGKHRYATPLEQIREVVDTKPCLPIPNAMPYVDGIVDLRGQLLSVLDVAKILGAASSGGVNRVTLVVEAETGLIGLNVEDLHEVVTLLPNQVMLEGMQPGEGRLDAVGMARLDGQLVTLLDLSDLVTRVPVLSA